MNKRIQTDVPLKNKLLSYLIYGIQRQIADRFSLLIYLKNGKSATLVFRSFQLKLQVLKCSESFVSENNHALPENVVQVYFKVCLNSKF